MAIIQRSVPQYSSGFFNLHFYGKTGDVGYYSMNSIFRPGNSNNLYPSFQTAGGASAKVAFTMEDPRIVLANAAASAAANWTNEIIIPVNGSANSTALPNVIRITFTADGLLMLGMN